MKRACLSAAVVLGVSLAAVSAQAQLVEVYRPAVTVGEPVVVQSGPIVYESYSPVVTSPPVVTYSPVQTYSPVETYSPVVTGRRVVTYSPVVTGPPVVTYRPAVTVYDTYRPAVTAYYSPYPSPVYAAPGPVYVGRPVVVRSKVYVPGQPVRNFWRAITP